MLPKPPLLVTVGTCMVWEPALSKLANSIRGSLSDREWASGGANLFLDAFVLRLDFERFPPERS